MERQQGLLQILNKVADEQGRTVADVVRVLHNSQCLYVSPDSHDTRNRVGHLWADQVGVDPDNDEQYSAMMTRLFTQHLPRLDV